MELMPMVEQIITLLVMIILGYIGMSPLNWLKSKFGLADGAATLFVWLASIVVGAVALLASGAIFEMQFSLENLLSIAAVFAAAAKYAYERFKTRNA